MTLDELKAQNAATEAEAEQDTPIEPEEAEEVAEEVEQDESGEAGEPSEGSSEAESEAWMQTDEQTSEGAVPVAKHVAMRAKLKGQVREQASEIESQAREIKSLRAEMEQLKSGKAQAQPPQQMRPMPKLADCDYDEEKHAQAIAQWVDERTEAKIKAQTQVNAKQQQQEAATRAISQAVDAHYDRAAELIAKQGISADLYQSADTKFRSVIESVMPGRGDTVADFLISNMEGGSEKVVYNVGCNAAVQQALQAKLLADPSGVKASIYLGELKAKAVNPVKRESTAPKPPTKIGGDEPAGDIVKRLTRQYKDAQKEGDMQKRIDLRRKLRQAGVNPDTL